jgi:hypothetical protein
MLRTKRSGNTRNERKKERRSTRKEGEEEYQEGSRKERIHPRIRRNAIKEGEE